MSVLVRTMNRWLERSQMLRWRKIKYRICKLQSSIKVIPKACESNRSAMPWELWTGSAPPSVERLLCEAAKEPVWSFVEIVSTCCITANDLITQVCFFWFFCWTFLNRPLCNLSFLGWLHKQALKGEESPAKLCCCDSPFKGSGAITAPSVLFGRENLGYTFPGRAQRKRGPNSFLDPPCPS